MVSVPVQGPPPTIPTVPPHLQQVPVPPCGVCVPVIEPTVAVHAPRPPPKQVIISKECPPSCPVAAVRGPPPTIPVVPPCFQPVQVPPRNVCVPVIEPAIPVLKPSRRRCKYVQPPRPRSFAPPKRYEKPCTKMEEGTVYKRSYIPVAEEKQRPIVPSNNLCVGTGKISGSTVNTMSYQSHRAKPACPILPCHHKLIGDGPMQDITTQKHDYVAKPSIKRHAIVPSANLVTSECPISDKTTNRLSYMPVRQCKQLPFIPQPFLQRSRGEFENSTVQKMSYQPFEPQAPPEMPWAKRHVFQPPVTKMAEDTVQKMSYRPPGMFVECDMDDPEGIACPESLQVVQEGPATFQPHYPGTSVLAPSAPAAVPCCPCPRASC